MKRMIIGGIFMLGGLILTSTILLMGAIYATTITQWSGKKLWFAIFGAKTYGDWFVDSLFVGWPFAFGIVLTIAGLSILVIEYRKPQD